ncbi:MAG: calcium/sodium antiporter [Kiritimatiellae bacterium]|nr:calcium/sodium antiporter [Kiritimatiellia bacterium]
MDYSDIPFWASLTLIVGGLAALAWSSDKFIEGAAALARAFGVSPFIVGMVIIGFGTSAPELCVSVMSGVSGHANLSLGNAYGSCTFNIAAILGIAALIHPLVMRPVTTLVSSLCLAAITTFSLFILSDGDCTRLDGGILLFMFVAVMLLYCLFDKGKKNECACQEQGSKSSPKVIAAALSVVIGLSVLIGSSHLLVWGSVDLARFLGVSDLMIGLTVIAIGTSLPELASAIAAARHGENEFVLGNIIGSNIFNTLAVVGLATLIGPINNAANGASHCFSPYILSRDLPVMLGLSLSIAIFGINWRKPREITKVGAIKGFIWILIYVIYTVITVMQEGKAY